MNLHRYAFTGLLLLTFSFLFNSTSQAQPSFNVAWDNIGISHTTSGSNYGSGATFIDIDGNGWDDIVLGDGNGGQLQVYLNTNGNLTQTALSGIGSMGETKQFLWVDYDNDGDLDFFVTEDAGLNKLFRNDAMTFTDVTVSAGLSQDSLPTWTAAFGDYDRDGWLDLYVTSYVYGTGLNFTNAFYRNMGDGTFQNVTMETGTADPDKSPLGVVFVDIDNDQWPDIFIGHDKMHGNVMLHNTGEGRFDDISAPANANQQICAMNAGIGDYDNDGFADIYVTNSPPGNVLLNNQGNGTFVDAAVTAGVAYYSESWGGNFVDFDHDMDEDLYVSGGGAAQTRFNCVYENQNNGTFLEMAGTATSNDTFRAYANAIGDINRDGFMDILVNAHYPDPSHVWINSDSTGSWLKVKLEGTVSNRDGVGARVMVYAGGQGRMRYTTCGQAFMAQNAGYCHFGLAAYTMADSITVSWPSGHIDRLYSVPVNQELTIVEGQTGIVMPQLFANGSLALCAGDSLLLHTNGRYATYTWSTGDTTAAIYVTQPGTYSVTTRDANGNIRSTSALTVTSMAAPSATASHIPNACYGDSTGTALVNATGGMAPYTYLWSDGQTGMMASGLAAGTYQVVVTDANGCTTSQQVTVTAPAELTATMSSTPDLSGAGNGTATVMMNGGVAPYSYLWDDSQAQTTATAMNLSAGMYSVSVVDWNGCMFMDSVDVMLLTALAPLSDAGWTAYPNPATDRLHLHAPKDVQGTVAYALYDLNGRQVLQGSWADGVSVAPISLEALPAGSYWLQLLTEAGAFTQRITKL